MSNRGLSSSRRRFLSPAERSESNRVSAGGRQTTATGRPAKPATTEKPVRPVPSRPVAPKLRGEGPPEDRRKLAAAIGPVNSPRTAAAVLPDVRRPERSATGPVAKLGTGKLAEAVSRRARQAMLMALDSADFGIAEMEALGLSLRVINLLEEKLGIIWLRELLAYDPQELRQKVPFLGQSGVDEIVGCLGRFDQLLDYQVRLAQALKPGPVPAR